MAASPKMADGTFEASVRSVVGVIPVHAFDTALQAVTPNCTHGFDFVAPCDSISCGGCLTPLVRDLASGWNAAAMAAAVYRYRDAVTATAEATVVKHFQDILASGGQPSESRSIVRQSVLDALEAHSEEQATLFGADGETPAPPSPSKAGAGAKAGGGSGGPMALADIIDHVVRTCSGKADVLLTRWRLDQRAAETDALRSQAEALGAENAELRTQLAAEMNAATALAARLHAVESRGPPPPPPTASATTTHPSGVDVGPLHTTIEDLTGVSVRLQGDLAEARAAAATLQAQLDASRREHDAHLREAAAQREELLSTIGALKQALEGGEGHRDRDRTIVALRADAEASAAAFKAQLAEVATQRASEAAAAEATIAGLRVQLEGSKEAAARADAATARADGLAASLQRSNASVAAITGEQEALKADLAAVRRDLAAAVAASSDATSAAKEQLAALAAGEEAARGELAASVKEVAILKQELLALAEELEHLQDVHANCGPALAAARALAAAAHGGSSGGGHGYHGHGHQPSIGLASGMVVVGGGGVGSAPASPPSSSSSYSTLVPLASGHSYHHHHQQDAVTAGGPPSPRASGISGGTGGAIMIGSPRDLAYARSFGLLPAAAASAPPAAASGSPLDRGRGGMGGVGGSGRDGDSWASMLRTASSSTSSPAAAAAAGGARGGSARPGGQPQRRLAGGGGGTGSATRAGASPGSGGGGAGNGNSWRISTQLAAAAGVGSGGFSTGVGADQAAATTTTTAAMVRV